MVFVTTDQHIIN